MSQTPASKHCATIIECSADHKNLSNNAFREFSQKLGASMYFYLVNIDILILFLKDIFKIETFYIMRQDSI